MKKNYLSPKEVSDVTIDVGVKKTSNRGINTLLLGILAGAFIAFAAEGSNYAAFNLWANPSTYGLGKAVAGSIFGTGLMLVIIAGAELFTGNNLILLSVLKGKVSVGAMLKNWAIVYIGNFLGAVLIAAMIVYSGQLHAGHDVLAATTIKIAVGKTSLAFGQALVLGILCNWLVCLAVWMAYAATDITGKILAIFFPIWLFITSGFEHSIANMYYIPAGILAKSNPQYLAAAKEAGVTAEKLAHLNWGTFVMSNLVPVTLGNIIGGAVLVAGIYYIIFQRD